ncbi:MAG: histidine kinase [Fluviicola sp.]|nr:histidine kinase [Fluviicola sp.]
MKLIRTLFTFLIFSSVSAQQPAYFMFAADEFEGVEIYDVIQDNDRNYWFATDQGLYKHNGYTFERVFCSKMKSTSVFDFVINKVGVIYCHNLNQQVFEIKNSICRLVFTIPDKGNDISLHITNQNDLVISSSRNMYVMNKKDEIYSSDLKEDAYLGVPFTLNTGELVVHQSASDSLLVYNRGQFYYKHLQNKDELNVLYFIPFKDKTVAINIKNKKCYSFNEVDFSLNPVIDCEINKGMISARFYKVENELWVANATFGVQIFNSDLRSIYSNSSIFTDYFISDIFKDKEGNILLSTFDQGVIVIPDVNVPDVIEVFSPYSITRMNSNSSGELFFGTNEGQILSYDYSVNELTPKGNKSIETLFYWKEKSLVFSDNKGFSVINASTSKIEIIKSESLKDAVSVSENQLLVATNKGLYKYTYNDNSQSFNDEYEIIIDGRMYEVERDNITEYIYVSTANGLMYITPTGDVNSFLINKEKVNASRLIEWNNKIFAVTRKYGIITFNKEAVESHIWTKYRGVDIAIFKILIHENKIYANTQKGLLVMDLKGNILHYLNHSSGLSTNKIKDFTINNDFLWVAHSRGVQKIELASLSRKIKKPELSIAKIFVNEILFSDNQNSFEAGQNKVRFELKVSTLKNRESIRYHYKLIGIDDKWTINEYENNVITFNTLGAGEYKFVVKAENNGVFCEMIYFELSIPAPFYQKWWFSTFVALIALVILTLFFKRKLKVQRIKSEQLNELHASKLTAIQSQMNPHFIFNSLNSIQDLVLKGDIDNSYTFITKFSNLVRRTLNYSDKDFIEFEQEIKLIELYLSLEKLRFKDNLNYTIDFEGVEDILVPPMLVQPFIENALVHGLLHKGGLKKLSVKFILEETLICEITDNGIGREKAKEIKIRQRSKHESFAVNAITKRFEILGRSFKHELGFEYEDLKKDGVVIGTKVILKIPIRRKF